jgi:hypothetical protein
MSHAKASPSQTQVVSHPLGGPSDQVHVSPGGEHEPPPPHGAVAGHPLIPPLLLLEGTPPLLLPLEPPLVPLEPPLLLPLEGTPPLLLFEPPLLLFEPPLLLLEGTLPLLLPLEPPLLLLGGPPSGDVLPAFPPQSREIAAVVAAMPSAHAVRSAMRDAIRVEEFMARNIPWRPGRARGQSAVLASTMPVPGPPHCETQPGPGPPKSGAAAHCRRAAPLGPLFAWRVIPQESAAVPLARHLRNSRTPCWHMQSVLHAMNCIEHVLSRHE